MKFTLKRKGKTKTISSARDKEESQRATGSKKDFVFKTKRAASRNKYKEIKFNIELCVCLKSE